jgi:hypothetical protein
MGGTISHLFNGTAKFSNGFDVNPSATCFHANGRTATDGWATDQDLALVATHCTEVTSVSLGSCKLITEAGLKYLTSLPKLQFVDLTGCDQLSKVMIERFIESAPHVHKVVW